MCLAIPMKVISLEGMSALTEVDGVTRQVRIDLLPEVQPGDYILVHAGLAISRLNTVEAEKTLELLRQLMPDEIQ